MEGRVRLSAVLSMVYVSSCLDGRKRPSARGCVIMLGQSTASPCPSAGGGSRHCGMAVTCVIAALDAITVWRSGQWGYRFLPVCRHHHVCTAAYGLRMVYVSLYLDGRIRPSAVLPPVASRCDGMSVYVLRHASWRHMGRQGHR